MPKRIVVVGAGGRLGKELTKFLSREHSVVGIDRRKMDLGSLDCVRAVMEPLDYDFVVITGALTAVDYCESHSEEAFKVNANGPEEIAKISRRKGAKVIYMSTDFVFDGRQGDPYREDDSACPISVYGASKLKGEEGVLSVSDENLVVRVSWVFGPERDAFPEWVVQQASEKDSVSLPSDKLGCPTWSVDLCSLLGSLIVKSEGAKVGGVYHLCNSGVCTWQEWGQACVDLAVEMNRPLRANEIGGVALSEVSAFVAKRPLNSALDTSKYTALTGVTPRHWQDALREHFYLTSSALAKV